jgi:hypothetical protein
LFSLRLEAQRTEPYASPLRSLRPRWKTVLNTLPHFIVPAIPVFNFRKTCLGLSLAAALLAGFFAILRVPLFSEIQAG